MFSYVLLIIFIFLLLFIWLKQNSSISKLALFYLSLTPFFPLISLIDHNLYNDVMKPEIKIIPCYLVLFFLFITILMFLRKNKKIKFGVGELLLLGYIFISFALLFFSSNLYWSIFTWSWSVPGFLIFYMAGKTSTDIELAKNKTISLAIVTFTLINLGLIIIGFQQGRYINIFYARNLGSIYASNSFLIFLMLYGGIGIIQFKKHSVLIRWTMIILLIVGIILTQSRTALFLLFAIYLIIIAYHHKRILYCHKRFFYYLTLFILIIIILYTSISHWSSLPSDLWENWQNRFGIRSGYSTSLFIQHVFLVRYEEVGKFAVQIINKNPLFGTGYGTFYQNSTSGYSDAHNLFFTEASENGLIATSFLYIFFIWAIIHIIKSPIKKEKIPLVVSIFGFLIIAHTTGAVLACKGLTMSYLTPFYGWAVFFLIGKTMAKNNYHKNDNRLLNFNWHNKKSKSKKSLKIYEKSTK